MCDKEIKETAELKNINGKTILITGATGFLGSFIVKELLNQTSCEIMI